LLYSLVIAVEEAVEEAEVEVENVTNVEKSGISLVHAPILLVCGAFSSRNGSQKTW
jgi:hypothetical protein